MTGRSAALQGGRGHIKRRTFVAAGVVLTATSFVAALNALSVYLTLPLVLGALMTAVAGFQCFHSLSLRKAGNHLFERWLLGGLFYALGAACLFVDPSFATESWTMILAVALAGSGLMRLSLGLPKDPARRSARTALSGLVSTGAAAAVAISWPGEVARFVLVLAIDVGVQGLILIAVGARMFARIR